MAGFGERVKALRDARGLTQDRFAAELTAVSDRVITRSTVSMWEAGMRTPKTEVLEAIADFFNVDMDYLLGRTDERFDDKTVAARFELAGKMFSKLTEEDQDYILGLLSRLSQSQ